MEYTFLDNTQTQKGKTMSNKNPFEIRAEMLTLAKEYMDTQYHLNIQLANDMFEQGKKTYEEVQQAYQIYSIEDLMEKAKEMYSFVSTKEK
jgi:hypothetical protein